MRRRSAALLALALLLPLPALAGEVVVKPGDTLGELAERYGTTVERLMQLNGLRGPQDLWAGSRIRVPGAGGGPAAGSGGGNYTVKSGETLSEIAERYGTSVQRLMDLNGLRSPQDLWAGSRIQVPGAGGARRTAAVVNKAAKQHTVQSGETLSLIADRYGIPMERLVALNGLNDPNDLMVGTTLKLRSTPRPVAAKPKPRPVTIATAKPPAKPAAKPEVKAPAVAAAPAPALAPAPAAKPVAEQPVAVAKPTPKPVVVAAKPVEKAAEPTAVASTTVATATVAPAPKPAVAAAPKPAPKPAAVAAKPGKSSSPDWRSYGPLQVDWANWMPMGGSYVAPSLNSEGQPLYLAINCNAKRLNATGQSGAWKTWDAPQSDFEQQLITDLCKAKGS
ncbi:MAG: LysM peptidoglycan-binding domain-containing protein [Vulcanococcus sp.]